MEKLTDKLFTNRYVEDTGHHPTHMEIHPVWSITTKR